jgi:four helix bundle protein
MTKAGCSIGANYRGANRARSRPDFKNKAAICQSEASECQYWLEITMDMRWLPEERIRPVHQECSELLAIFTTICSQK